MSLDRRVVAGAVALTLSLTLGACGAATPSGTPIPTVAAAMTKTIPASTISPVASDTRAANTRRRRSGLLSCLNRTRRPDSRRCARS